MFSVLTVEVPREVLGRPREDQGKTEGRLLPRRPHDTASRKAQWSIAPIVSTRRYKHDSLALSVMNQATKRGTSESLHHLLKEEKERVGLLIWTL